MAPSKLGYGEVQSGHYHQSAEADGGYSYPSSGSTGGGVHPGYPYSGGLHSGYGGGYGSTGGSSYAGGGKHKVCE